MDVPFGTAQKVRKGRREIVDIVLAIPLMLFLALEHSVLPTSPFPRFPGPELKPLFSSLHPHPEKSLPYTRIIAVDEKQEEFLFEPDLAANFYSGWGDFKSGELSRKFSGDLFVSFVPRPTAGGSSQKGHPIRQIKQKNKT